MAARFGTKCSIHIGQKLEYFCCDKLICVSCQIDHSNHISLMSISEKCEEVKRSIPNYQTSLQNLQSYVDRKIWEYESLRTKNEENRIKNKEKIQKKIKNLMKHLKEVEANLQNEFENGHTRIKEILNTITDHHRGKKEDIISMRRICDRIPNMQTEIVPVQNAMQLRNKLDDFLANRELQYQQPQIPEFIAAETMPNKNILRQIIGSVNDGLDMDSDWVTTITEQYEIEKKFKVKWKNIGISPVGTDCGWLYRIGTNGPIQLVSQNGDKIIEIPSQNIEKIFTTSRKNAWITKVGTENITVLKQRGEFEHRFKIPNGFHCFGICPTKSGTGVWICLANAASFVPNLKGKTKVVKMTVWGGTVCEIECSYGQNVFTFPYRCVESTVNEDVYVIDRLIEDNKGQVLFFNKDGKPTGGYIGTDLNREFNPRDICCNSQGDIIISDFSNDAIHILFPEGNLQNILRLDLRSLKKPLSVAVDDTDRMWVTFNNGDIVIITNYHLADHSTLLYSR